MLESAFWNKIREGFDKGGFNRETEFERVESIVESMPDVYFYSKTKKKHCGWIELKTVNVPNHRIKFESGQPEWIERNYLAGANVFVCVEFADLTMLFSGSKIRQLSNRRLMDVDSILTIDTGPKAWPALYGAILKSCK